MKAALESGVLAVRALRELAEAAARAARDRHPLGRAPAARGEAQVAAPDARCAHAHPASLKAGTAPQTGMCETSSQLVQFGFASSPRRAHCRRWHARSADSSAAGIYHVTHRTAGPIDMFRDDVDRTDFCVRLARVIRKHDWVCHSFVLMPTHYHLLLGWTTTCSSRNAAPERHVRAGVQPPLGTMGTPPRRPILRETRRERRALSSLRSLHRAQPGRGRPLRVRCGLDCGAATPTASGFDATFDLRRTPALCARTSEARSRPCPMRLIRDFVEDLERGSVPGEPPRPKPAARRCRAA